MIPDTPSSAASGMGDGALLRALIEELRPYAACPLGSIRVDTDDIRKIVDGFDALSAKDLEMAEARVEIERLKRKLAEQVEATAFADENRTFQIERAEKAEATARGLRRLLKINDDPPKPGFHCACAYHLQTAAQVEECGAHADLRARAEKAERNWDIVLKSAKFWEETHYAQMTAISAAIGSTRFMDPPDGGDVSLADQVRRMREALDAAEFALREIATFDCGCKPCTGQCRKGEAAEIELEARVAIARSVLTPVLREQRGEEA